MARFERGVLLEKFHDMIARGQPIVGGGAGTGLSAKCEEAGGVDLIVIYNSGRYRMAGRGSLAGLMPYGDANAIVVEMAELGARIGRKAAAATGPAEVFWPERGISAEGLDPIRTARDERLPSAAWRLSASTTTSSFAAGPTGSAASSR